MFDRELSATAAAMVARGKGILATDESAGMIKQRFGQINERATADPNAMNARGAESPWPLSFSYRKASQARALKAWIGQPGNVAAAQKALLHRANPSSAACFGRDKAEAEMAALAARIAATCP